MRFAIVMLLVLTTCSSPSTPPQAIVQSDTYGAGNMLLNYANPLVARYYHAVPATTHRFDNARIGISRIHSIPTSVPKTQTATWDRFASSIAGNQVIYIPESRTNLYISDDKATNFLAGLAYIQSIAAQYQLHYVIMYQTETLARHEQTTSGEAVEESVLALPDVAQYPVGLTVMAATSPFAQSTRALVSYTDAYLINVHAGTIEQYRSFSDVTDINMRVMGGWREKEQEAYKTLPQQSLQRMLDQLTGR